MLIKKEELTIRSLTPDENYMQLIIEAGGKSVGEMNCHNMGNKTAQISIEIEPEMRDKGYGTRFLSMLIEHLFTNANYMKIILDVDLDNHRARHVYEKLGFRVTRVKEDCGVADYELVKK
jgi:diamine N-acetyltransferase